ncbi:RpiB/LacA/LacB family sugar-phosphate isomerase [candidate division WWE3 bacterium]|nr:RpiB/LacA/LacB family sugar-phosphate isomerase [candidate division WWE3 bacterium]
MITGYMKVIIGADHRGYNLKEQIKSEIVLESDSVEWVDVGAHSIDQRDDYTDFAEAAAQTMEKESIDFAVLICGSGIGISIAANKFDGIRCGLGINVAQVAAGREDDDINVLAIAADFTAPEESLAMVHAFLTTVFSEEARYRRRLEEIEIIEEQKEDE